MPRLTYIGHAAFALESHGHSVLIDPWITGNPAATHSAADFSPQTILVTHAHDDHLGDTLDIAKRTGAKVITVFELGEYLLGQGAENAIPANQGGTVQFEGGSTKLTPAWHSSSYGPNCLAPGVPAGHIVRFDGVTFYFAGDTSLFGDMKLIGEEGIDVAVLPIGDLFTMGPADAVRAAGFVNAKYVVPCHYNTFDAIAQDDAAFKAAVEEKTDSTCIVLEPGESHDFAADS